MTHDQWLEHDRMEDDPFEKRRREELRALGIVSGRGFGALFEKEETLDPQDVEDDDSADNKNHN